MQCSAVLVCVLHVAFRQCIEALQCVVLLEAVQCVVLRTPPDIIMTHHHPTSTHAHMCSHYRHRHRRRIVTQRYCGHSDSFKVIGSVDCTPPKPKTTPGRTLLVPNKASIETRMHTSAHAHMHMHMHTQIYVCVYEILDEVWSRSIENAVPYGGLIM